jgi:carboxypeptidase D
VVHALFISSSHALSEFYVDGTTLPLVKFDVGPSWSGLIPISAAANETRKVQFLGNSTGDFGSVLLTSQLFFWFFPPGPEGSLDDLILWYAVYLDAWAVA